MASISIVASVERLKPGHPFCRWVISEGPDLTLSSSKEGSEAMLSFWSAALMTQGLMASQVQRVTGSKFMRALFPEKPTIWPIIAILMVYSAKPGKALSYIRTPWATYGQHRWSRNSRSCERWLLKPLW